MQNCASQPETAIAVVVEPHKSVGVLNIDMPTKATNENIVVSKSILESMASRSILLAIVLLLLVGSAFSINPTITEKFLGQADVLEHAGLLKTIQNIFLNGARNHPLDGPVDVKPFVLLWQALMTFIALISAIAAVARPKKAGYTLVLTAAHFVCTPMAKFVYYGIHTREDSTAAAVGFFFAAFVLLCSYVAALISCCKVKKEEGITTNHLEILAWLFIGYTIAWDRDICRCIVIPGTFVISIAISEVSKNSACNICRCIDTSRKSCSTLYFLYFWRTMRYNYSSDELFFSEVS